MWTKIMNALGFETKAQKYEYQLAMYELEAAMRAEAKARERFRNARLGQSIPVNVITTDDVPTKGNNKGTVKRPSKPSQQVRAERYGVGNDEAYRTPGFNSYYDPSSSYSSNSDSSCSSGSYSDSGSSSGSCDSGGSW